MKPARWPITIPQGGDFQIQFKNWRDSAGDLIDLSPFTGAAQMRTSDVATGDPLLEFTVDVDPTTHTITVSAPAAQTALVDSSGAWDLLLISADQTIRLIEGAARLDRNVTVS